MVLSTSRDATDRLRNKISGDVLYFMKRDKRNTYLINICKLGKDFALIYMNFEFDFLTKYHSFI